MRWAWVSCLLLASLLPLLAEDWTTEDGKTYKNVTVVGQESDGVRITYEGGVGKIPYYELPVDIQKRFGQDVDSLAAKKQAVDQAIDDAARSAAAAGQMKLPVEVPGAVIPQAAPNGGTAVAPAPGMAPGTTAASGAGPGGGTPSAGAPNAAPGTQANGAPGGASTNAVTVAHPPNGVARVGPAQPQPDLAEPMSHTPMPDGIAGAGGKPLQLAVANYSYNSALDVCYLDSPPIEVFPETPPKTPLPVGQSSSLTLRIVTDGRTPQIPDRFETTFLSVGGDGSDLGAWAIAFGSDDSRFTLDDSAKKDSGTVSSGGQAVQYISFYLEPSQAHQLGNAKTVMFTVGAGHYRLNDRGVTILRDYLSDVDHLQPATSSFVRSFYKLLARIPSFFAIISTVCEYVILGSFALLVAASIAAFILGISRFIKM